MIARPSSPAAQALRSALAASGLGANEAARLLPYDARTLRHWLAGRREPPPDALARVLDRLAEIKKTKTDP